MLYNRSLLIIYFMVSSLLRIKENAVNVVFRNGKGVSTLSFVEFVHVMLFALILASTLSTNAINILSFLSYFVFLSDSRLTEVLLLVRHFSCMTNGLRRRG